MAAQSATAAGGGAAWPTMPAVPAVHYPGLPSASRARDRPAADVAPSAACSRSASRGGREAALRGGGRARLFTRATSLGGVESLIEHRATSEGPALDDAAGPDPAVDRPGACGRPGRRPRQALRRLAKEPGQLGVGSSALTQPRRSCHRILQDARRRLALPRLREEPGELVARLRIVWLAGLTGGEPLPRRLVPSQAGQQHAEGARVREPSRGDRALASARCAAASAVTAGPCSAKARRTSSSGSRGSKHGRAPKASTARPVWPDSPRAFPRPTQWARRRGCMRVSSVHRTAAAS